MAEVFDPVRVRRDSSNLQGPSFNLRVSLSTICALPRGAHVAALLPYVDVEPDLLDIVVHVLPDRGLVAGHAGMYCDGERCMTARSAVRTRYFPGSARDQLRPVKSAKASSIFEDPAYGGQPLRATSSRSHLIRRY